MSFLFLKTSFCTLKPCGNLIVPRFWRDTLLIPLQLSSEHQRCPCLPAWPLGAAPPGAEAGPGARSGVFSALVPHELRRAGSRVLGCASLSCVTSGLPRALAQVRHCSASRDGHRVIQAGTEVAGTSLVQPHSRQSQPRPGCSEFCMHPRMKMPPHHHCDSDTLPGPWR